MTDQKLREIPATEEGWRERLSLPFDEPGEPVISDKLTDIWRGRLTHHRT